MNFNFRFRVSSSSYGSNSYSVQPSQPQQQQQPSSYIAPSHQVQQQPQTAYVTYGHVSLNYGTIPDRRVLEKFPRSQHRSSLIKSSKTVVSLPSEPYRRWNLWKVKWKKYTRITNRLAGDQSWMSRDVSRSRYASRDTFLSVSISLCQCLVSVLDLESLGKWSCLDRDMKKFWI